jgi:hypothetical protein
MATKKLDSIAPPIATFKTGANLQTNGREYAKFCILAVFRDRSDGNKFD